MPIYKYYYKKVYRITAASQYISMRKGLYEALFNTGADLEGGLFRPPPRYQGVFLHAH